MREKRNKKEAKTHLGFWASPALSGEIDRGTELAMLNSRSEFIEKAIRQYIRYLEGEKTDAQKILAEIRNFEKHMASVLFKLAGEEANIALLLADRVYNVSDYVLRSYRNSAYGIVRKRKGMLSFPGAVKAIRTSRGYRSGDEDSEYNPDPVRDEANGDADYEDRYYEEDEEKEDDYAN